MAWLRSGRFENKRIAAPHWPASGSKGGPRILVEHPEPAARYVIAHGLRAHGYEVVDCGGPDVAGAGPRVACPVLSGQSCPAVDGADIIVSSFHIGDSQEGRVVRQLATDAGSPPMVIEAMRWQVERTFGDPDALTHHYPFGSVDEVVTAIESLRAPVASCSS